MKLVNISNGPRGAYIGPQLVMVEAGATSEGDFTDVNPEWFDEGDAEDLAAKTVAELRDIAAAEGIDLGESTKKADIVAAIELAREAAE